MAVEELTRPALTAAHDRGAVSRRGVAVLRRTPFTATVTLLLVAVGLAVEGYWRSVSSRPWFDEVGYGVPSLVAGRVWTPVTGALLGNPPVRYALMTVFFALLVGFTEYRIGTRRAASVFVLGHLGSVVVAVGLLWALRTLDWDWAKQVAGVTDVGLSGGTVACAAVASAGLRPPWRLRSRALLLLVVGVTFLFIGTLSDLVRLVAVLGALPLGPKILGRPLRPTYPSRREWRLFAVTGFLVVSVVEVILWLVPSSGPLGPTGYEDASALRIAVNLVLLALIVNGLRKGRLLAWWAGVVLCVLNVVAGLASFVVAAFDVLLDNTDDSDAQTIAAAVLWAALLVVLVLGRQAFRAPMPRHIRRRGLPNATTHDVAKELLERYGGSSVSWMSTWEDNSYFLTADEQAFVAYQPHVGVAISIGDPVGPPGSNAETVSAFAAMCERAGQVPCLFSVTAQTAAATDRLGWQRIQVAEDSVIDLPDLQFKGKQWQDIRSALNRAAKEGIAYRELRLAEAPFAIQSQVRLISEEWVGDKGLPEMGFTLGGVDEAMDPAVRVGLAVDGDGSVHGVTSWMPVYAEGGQVVGWTLDVMRRRNGAFRPVVEFLIASAAMSFKEQGARYVSLSGAPLARSGSGAAMSAVEKMLDSLGQAMEPMYGFRSLHAFKAKFSPRYEPMYMCYRDEADLPRIGLALTRAYLPEASMGELVRMGISRPH